MGEEETQYPDLLYRFRSDRSEFFLEELDRAINGQELYMAPLSGQNDPFEARPYFSTVNLKEVINYLTVFEKRFGKDTLITGTSVHRAAMDRGLDPKAFKKQFKKFQKTPVAYAKFLEKTILSSFSGLRNTANIVCFSEDWRSLLMWSHYCSGHGGVCLEFEIDRAVQDKVIGPISITYQTEWPEVSVLEAFRYVANANLGHQAPDFFNEAEVIETMNKTMMTKSSEWAYEGEWRFSEIAGRQPGYRKILKLRVKRILIGVNTNKETKAELLQRFAGTVEIFEVKLDNKEFRLSAAKLG